MLRTPGAGIEKIMVKKNLENLVIFRAFRGFFGEFRLLFHFQMLTPLEVFWRFCKRLSVCEKLGTL
jgi:hypothetical protein